MPIYEYYCSACQGRFSHLARTVDAAAPPCPRCGTSAVERLISAARVLHSTSEREREVQAGAAQVDQNDPQAIARFLTESGHLEDAEGAYGSEAYRELLARRSAGATDAELSDLSEALIEAVTGDAEAEQTAERQLLGGLLQSGLASPAAAEHTCEGHTCHHDHDHDHHHEHEATKPPPRRHAEDLGWAH